MNKKKKNAHLVTTFLVIFIVLFLVAVVALVLFKTKMDEYSQTASDLQAQLDANTQYVYVAMDDLPAGTVLEENKTVMLQQNITGLPSSMYMTADDLGKILVIDVDAYEPVMANMVTDEVFEADTRELEIGVANLMLDQAVNDYVDIRIMFPDGSDYIVASKLKVKSMSLENSIFYTNMGEDEIITLASATIDAYTVTGTKIYLTRYVQSNMQEEAAPNYPVKSETLALMQSDPNILQRAQETLNAQARADLEARLAMLSEEELGAVATGHGLEDTAHTTAFVDGNNNANVFADGTEITDMSEENDGTVDTTDLPLEEGEAEETE